MKEKAMDNVSTAIQWLKEHKREFEGSDSAAGLVYTMDWAAAMESFAKYKLREAGAQLRERLAAVEDTNDWRGGIIRGLEDAADLLAEMGSPGPIK